MGAVPGKKRRAKTADIDSSVYLESGPVSYQARKKQIKATHLKRGIYIAEKLTEFRRSMDDLWSSGDGRRGQVNIFDVRQAAQLPFNLITGKIIKGKDRYNSQLTKVSQITNIHRGQPEAVKDMQEQLIAYHRAIRDAKRAIGFWDENQRLITEMRVFGANKMTLKDVLSNPSLIKDYFKVKKLMVKTAREAVGASYGDILAALINREGWKSMLDKIEDFLAGSEFWDQYRLEVKQFREEHGISEKEWRDMYKSVKK